MRASIARPIAAAFATSIALGACSSVNVNTPTLFQRMESARTDEGTGLGLEAPLRAIGGSAVQGKVRVVERKDGVTVMLSAQNIMRGPYRMAFHEKGNCTSPNGFSAGLPWAPPASSKAPDALIPSMYATAEGSVESQVFVPGVRISGDNGLTGRSIVIYLGSSIPTILADRPNSAIACGAFEAVRPIIF
jgi:Cu/Zn superoxide dismutase